MATLSFNQMRKTLVSNQPELYNTQLLLKQSLYNRVRNKLFWIWDKEQHKQADIDNNGDCCFNLTSQIPGRVVSVLVEPGNAVKKGDAVVILESMKMQVAVKAHKDGNLKEIRVKQGAAVARNDIVAIIE